MKALSSLHCIFLRCIIQLDLPGGRRWSPCRSCRCCIRRCRSRDCPAWREECCPFAFAFCWFLLFGYGYLLAFRARVVFHVSVPAAVEEAGGDEVDRDVAALLVHHRFAGDDARVSHLGPDVGAVGWTPVVFLQVISENLNLRNNNI